MSNLWPSELIAKKSPHQILCEQAEEFNNNPLYRSLSASVVPETDKIILVISTEVDKHTLLEVTNAKKYPCKVFWDGTQRQALTTAKFMGILIEIFHSQKVQSILGHLAASQLNRDIMNGKDIFSHE